MTISYTKLLFAFVIFAPVFMYAQSNNTGYLETEVALGYAVAPTYSHNFSISQRFFYVETAKMNSPQDSLILLIFLSLKYRPEIVSP